ncbi:DUF2157 domain-containing protein [Candidatus Peribacteria bacterium]|jgi:hypothetical protein|nr:DUF2157 domain-containing protein [Candidatus Peribacteria bacterium]MBT4021023.1 DUF2157 domain-containing protein [Candidatus Peribacteria bacterium]MBT4240921.1 DUF2157 domain-containing protein [Candidatus Peribacteria bacterium]MBT4474565.1 DUF2157 domain-containing protein [Candidatus Peribacteria bacterium]
MNKKELLKELSEKVASGSIDKSEVMDAISGEGIKKSMSHLSIMTILYFIGAVAVIMGIIFFIAQVWEDIGSFVRVSITLGMGLIMTMLGSMLVKEKEKKNIGLVFQFIGGLLIPGGSMVLLSEFSTGVVHMWPIAITIGIIFLFYLILDFAQKNPILTFFAIANGTAFIYLLIGALTEGQASYKYDDLYAYTTMIIGASYLALSHNFKTGWNRNLVGILQLVGSFGFFVAAFSRVEYIFAGQILYFFVLGAGLFLSIYMKSKAILLTSTVFLIVHFVYITDRYFADSLGWPISLIILGLIIIALGYGSVEVNKKYLKK